MKRNYRFIAFAITAFLFFLFSCSSDDHNAPSPKLISVFGSNNGNATDSLFYQNGKLKEIRLQSEGVSTVRFSRYYSYNNNGQLTEITYTDNSGVIMASTKRYTYYPDGSLKTKFHSNRTDYYTYYDGLIFVNEGTDKEQKITLDAQQRITKVELTDLVTKELFLFTEYFYSEEGNISRLKTYVRNELATDFVFQHDNKTNPYRNLDQDLPFGGSLSILEQSNRLPPFPFANNWLDLGYAYFNKNNITSLTNSTNAAQHYYNYRIIYDDDGYPLEFTYNYDPITFKEDYELYIGYW